jgi:hypothetical protein
VGFGSVSQILAHGWLAPVFWAGYHDWEHEVKLLAS